jgi:hypothetical protein
LPDSEYRVHRGRRVQASRLDQGDGRDLQRRVLLDERIRCDHAVAWTQQLEKQLALDHPGQLWRRRRTDLLFYDQGAGYGEFYTTDGSGGIRFLRAQPGWRTTWDIIVPGNFGGSGWTDLLFYDRETGTGQFYATDGGTIQQLRTYTNWRTSWDLIIPGDFGGDGHTDLLFYDRSAGVGEFYTTDGRGGITHLQTHAIWRGHGTWSFQASSAVTVTLTCCSTIGPPVTASSTRPTAAAASLN